MAKVFQKDCEITMISALKPNIIEMYIKSDEIAGIAVSGQFIHILCGDLTLRRPISICEILKDRGLLRIVFEVKGSGTLWLSQRKSGEKINILGPLGHGFEVFDGKKAVFVGGGIGVIPLLDIAEKYNNSKAILGFRNRDFVILEDDFKNYCDVTVATDDGTYGAKGFVTEILKEHLKSNGCDVIYACGPMKMLEAVSKIADEFNIVCYVSLEERMGCGIGACLTCACKTRDENGEHYRHVCKNGPVFKSTDIVF